MRSGLQSVIRCLRKVKNKFVYIVTRYIKYAASTLAGTAVDNIVLWICSDYLLDGSYWREYILSPCIGFECAVMTNFVIAYFGVWRDRISSRSTRSFFRHYLGYNLSCTGTFFIRMCLLNGIGWLTGWDVVWCNLTAMCFSGLIKFMLNEKVVFRLKKNKNTTNPSPITDNQ